MKTKTIRDMNNEQKAKELSEIWDSESLCYSVAMEMAEWKDNCLKNFLKTFISIEYNGELDEYGNPIDAKEYFDYLDEKLKKAEEVFKEYKEFEKNNDSKTICG